MINGPRRVGAAELARLARADGALGLFVTLRAEDMVEVGEKWEEPESGERRVVATLHLAKVGDHALLVETAPGVASARLDRLVR